MVFHISQKVVGDPRVRVVPEASADPADCHEDREHGEVQKLVLPDLLHELVPSLRGVDDHVRGEQNQHGERAHVERVREVGGERERGGVDQAVVGQDLPAFALVRGHPVGLEREVGDEVDGDEQKEQVDERDHEVSPCGCASVNSRMEASEEKRIGSTKCSQRI